MTTAIVTQQATSLRPLDVRVYYEDTDAAGVVYHANYLKFMERARSEFLRQYKLDAQSLIQQHGCQFAVVAADTQWRAPAKLGDLLQVTVTVSSFRRISICFHQQVLRDDQSDALTLLCCSDVTVGLCRCR